MVLVQEKHIETMVQDFKAESIANTLWAYATAMRQPGEAILDVLHQSEEIISFDVRDVADALWALAVFSINCPNSFKPGHWLGVEQIGRRAEDLAGRLDSTALMETLWALAMLRFDPKSGVVVAMERQIEVLATELHAPDIARSLWALAILGYTPREKLVSALVRRSRAIRASFSAQDIADTLSVASFLSLTRPDVAFRFVSALNVSHAALAPYVQLHVDALCLLANDLSTEGLWSPGPGWDSGDVGSESRAPVGAEASAAPLGPDPESVGVTAPPILSEGVLALITKQAVHDIEAFGPQPQQTWTPMQLRCPYA